MSEITELQKVFAEEAERYRNHLQIQFNQLKWAIGIAVTAFATIYIFFYGKTAGDVEKFAKSQVTERIVDHHVDEKIKNQISERLNLFTLDEIDEARRIIAAEVKQSISDNLESETKGKIEAEAKIFLDNLQERGESILKGVLDIPTGTILPFAGDKPPNDKWLLCDGRNIPASSEFDDLRRVLNGFFGPNQLPDLRGRAVIGAGKGIDLSERRLGVLHGSETHTLTIREMPKHGHNPDSQFDLVLKRGNSFSGDRDGYRSDRPDLTEGAPLMRIGGSQPHNNMQPSLVVNFIIKAK